MIQIITGKWEGLEGLGEELLAELRPRATIAVKRAAIYFAGEIKKTLSGQRHGRTYRVSKRGPVHVASAPGEPPAVLHGNLRNSVGSSEPSWDGDVCSSEVGPGLGQAVGLEQDPARAYARRLEWGGRDSRGVMIEARPYMEPTAERVAPEIDRIFREEIE